nr:MAG: replication initiator protein [Microviridae sp.]
MCLYPQLIRNPKYTLNKKNGGQRPPIYDNKTLYVPIQCGNCIECRAKKARDWQVRLTEETKRTPNGAFITLTFNTESLNELSKTTETQGYTKDNHIATIGVRRFLERWRKTHKVSLRHWFVTELGHQGTEHIHLHGIIWLKRPEDLLELPKIWNYGFTWQGKAIKEKGAITRYENYVNQTTVAYIVKYITKKNTKHEYYKSIILTSPGIGKEYINTHEAKNNKYNDDKTKETYRTKTGHEMMLPQYYRQKIYTDHEREMLWLQKMNTEERYVLGQKAETTEEYLQLLKQAKAKNKRLKYGSNQIDYHKKEQETKRRIEIQKQRTENKK